MTFQITSVNVGDSVTLRGIVAAAEYMNCNEKTVRRALKSTGIVKKTFQIRVLAQGKVHST